MDENRVVIRTGATIKLGDIEAEVRGEGAPLIYHDLVTESRFAQGAICISLGAVCTDGVSAPVVQVVARHRMSVLSAQILRNQLTELIDLALKPVNPSKTN